MEDIQNEDTTSSIRTCELQNTNTALENAFKPQNNEKGEMDAALCNRQWG